MRILILVILLALSGINPATAQYTPLISDSVTLETHSKPKIRQFLMQNSSDPYIPDLVKKSKNSSVFSSVAYGMSAVFIISGIAVFIQSDMDEDFLGMAPIFATSYLVSGAGSIIIGIILNKKSKWYLRQAVDRHYTR